MPMTLTVQGTCHVEKEKIIHHPPKYKEITHRQLSAHLAHDKIPFSSVEKGLKTF